MKYYKISPEWAKKLNISGAPEHPDGWRLVLPTQMTRAMRLIPAVEYGTFNNVDEAVKAIGGCVYTQAEALASQRGEEEYMMNRSPEESGSSAGTPVGTIPETEKEETPSSEVATTEIKIKKKIRGDGK